jgi:chitinase
MFRTENGMRTHRTILAAALIALTTIATGCADTKVPTSDAPSLAIARIGSVTVTPTTASVAAGSSVQLAASARSRRGFAIVNPVFSWSSADTTVAKVSVTGLVAGVKAGTSVITVARNGAVATTTITVTGSVVVTPPDTTPKPPVPPSGTSGRWVSGYYAGYQRNLYPETSIDFSLLTHIFVAAIEPAANGGVTSDFFVDAVNGPAMARTISTRAHAAGRKAILMLGGAGYRDALAGATTPGNMATFVNNLVTTMTTLGYDGIDVDWEPISSADQPIVLDLLKRLRAARPGIILTIPVGWHGPLTSWYAQVAAVVDQINIMSYGMAGNWGGWDSWHQSALFDESATHPTSVSGAVKLYQAVGVPNAKLGIGIGFYGSCWKGVNTMRVALPASAGVTADDNTMSYVNIMSSYYNVASYKWDAAAKEGYLSFAAATGPAACTMVSYDDPQAITEKGNYVRSAGLGGTIIWTINQGYFPNAAVGSRDPLLKAAYTSIAP